jgi:hypothetical protein
MKNYVNTSIYTGSDDALTVKLHNTEIVKIYSINTNPLNQVHSGKIKLNHGGWQTVTTKRRMNEASDAFMPGGLGFRVYQKDFEWYIERDNGDVYDWEGQFITFSADPEGENPRKIQPLKEADDIRRLMLNE